MDETGPGLEKMLDALRRTAPVVALTLRDERGRLVASSGHAGERPVPKETLQPEELLAVPAGPPRTLSPEGSRVVLKTRARVVGSLDVWGEGTLLTADVRLLVADLAALLGVRLDRGTAEPS